MEQKKPLDKVTLMRYAAIAGVTLGAALSQVVPDTWFPGQSVEPGVSPTATETAFADPDVYVAPTATNAPFLAPTPTEAPDVYYGPTAVVQIPEQVATQDPNAHPKFYGEEDHIKDGSRYITDENAFSEEQLKIVEAINREYGIQIVSPVFWDGRKNNAWEASELQIVLDTIRQLPPAYLKAKLPDYLYLIKPDGTSGSSGGEAGAGVDMSLYLPTDSGVTDPVRLKEVVVHEFTHNYSRLHQDMEKRFEAQVGWEWNWDTLTWQNSYPELLNYSDYAAIKSDPIEDLADTVGYAYSYPSKLDQKRIDFLLNDPVFKDWDLIASLR